LIARLMGRTPARLAVALLVLALVALASACGGGSGTGGGGGKPLVVASENFWGSIASQVGGSQVQVKSIITNPDADPHSYETNANDAKLVAQSAYVIYNGAGYDSWMQDKLLKSNPSSSRLTLDIANLVGKQDGDNPHFWYSPDYVHKVIEQIATQLKQLNGVDGSAIDSQKTQFESSGLKSYTDTIAAIKQKYAGTAVGSTESIFVYMSDALGLNLITPPGYMKAISEGNDPTAADKVTVDQQVTQKQLKVLVFNSQNSTPDVQAVVNKAKTEKIPVAQITETLTPANLTFQAWQVKELQGIQQALASAQAQA
jgi:zinc/manganese transport system substrate-binding protein